MSGGNAQRPPVVAAFDVDGTLTIRDCVRPFLLRVGGWRGVSWSLARRPVATVAASFRRDRDRFKEIVVGGVMRRRSVDQVEHLGREFADDVHREWLRDDTLGRLRWHQGMGHSTVLVSASLGAYLRPLAARLNVDDVLCTDPARDGDVFVDGLEGLNCRAEEKARRLDAWLVDRDLTHAEVWAYGDSAGDHALLARADRGELVKAARVTAVPEGWQG